VTALIRRSRMLQGARLLLLASVALAAPILLAQSGPASKTDSPPASDATVEVPKFEVATIKPGTDDGRMMLMFTPDGVSISGVAMQMILREAFLTEDDRIVGAPGWVKSTKYDIQAKVDAADAPKLEKLKIDQRRSMLVPLLVERFNLKYHHETRELPMYALVVAKGGLKMKESKPEDAAVSKPGDAAVKNAPPQQGQHMLRFMGRGHLESTGTGVPFLVHILSEQLGRSIVDKTGLTGDFDYTLTWTPDDGASGMPGGGAGGPPPEENAGDTAGPSLFTAVQEQLGLKLESEKGMADVIVIDHIDLPSQN
jgi:uncharacterized protein (TIGR03435 family)